MTSVETCLTPNQEDTYIQGVKAVTNVEKSTVQKPTNIDQIHDNAQAAANTALCVDADISPEAYSGKVTFSLVT